MQPVGTAVAGSGAWKPAGCTRVKTLKGEIMKRRIEKKAEKKKKG